MKQLISISSLTNDAACFQQVRSLRWPDGVTCPPCGSQETLRRGKDNTHPERQRYQCKGCQKRFDDLTGTVFEGQSGNVEFDEVYVKAGHKGNPEAVAGAGREGRRRALKGAPGRGTLEKDKPPIFGMIQRSGDVVIRMLANVKQATIKPLMLETVAAGTLVYTDEYNIYKRLEEWGYPHKINAYAQSGHKTELLGHLHEVIKQWQ